MAWFGSAILLRPWDVAAGRADRAETGGGVTNLDVSAFYLDALAQHQYPRKQWQAASRYARDDR
jgi:hypothetical protein